MTGGFLGLQSFLDRALMEKRIAFGHTTPVTVSDAPNVTHSDILGALIGKAKSKFPSKMYPS